MELNTYIKINGEHDYSDKDFSEGYVAVIQKKEKYGLMDKTENWYCHANSIISENLRRLGAGKQDSLYGYIDLKGTGLLSPSIMALRYFITGWLPFPKWPYLEEKYGFIDHSGKIIIPITIYSNYNPYQPMGVFQRRVPACEKDGWLTTAMARYWKMDKE